MRGRWAVSYFTLKNGMKLYYEDRGEGQPIVFLHGWTSSHSIYSAPVKKISQNAHCISYDHRGHAGSKLASGEAVTMETLASDLNEIIEGLQLRDIILVGWSMGAGVAMTYVKSFGCDALKQIVLCDMTPKQINDDGWKLGLYKGKYTVEDMNRSTDKKFLSLYHSFAVGAMPRLRKIPDFLLDIILKRRLKSCDENILASLSKSMKLQDNRDVIGKITVPLTYFYAEPGSLFSPELAKWYEINVKTRFNKVAFSDSSHMFISEHPDKFAEEIINILHSS